MSRIATWWPVAVAGVVTVGLVAGLTLTQSGTSLLPPLPSPLKLSPAAPSAEQAEGKRPIFAAAAPTDDVAKEASSATPAPVLTGIAIGRGAAIALIKKGDGQTVRAHVGDVIDGWTIRVILPKMVGVERTGIRLELMLEHDQGNRGSGTPASPKGELIGAL